MTALKSRSILEDHTELSPESIDALDPSSDIILAGVTSVELMRIAAYLSKTLEVELREDDYYLMTTLGGIDELVGRSGRG